MLSRPIHRFDMRLWPPIVADAAAVAPDPHAAAFKPFADTLFQESPP